MTELRMCAATFVQAFEDYQKNLKIYADKIAELKTHYGFEFKRVAGHLIVTQQDYELEERFPLEQGPEIHAELLKVGHRAEEKYLQWNGELETLPAKGFEVRKYPDREANGDIPAEIIHPELKKPIRITLHGPLERVDEEGREKITALLDFAFALDEETQHGAAPRIVKPGHHSEGEKPKNACSKIDYNSVAEIRRKQLQHVSRV